MQTSGVTDDHIEDILSSDNGHSLVNMHNEECHLDDHSYVRSKSCVKGETKILL